MAYDAFAGMTWQQQAALSPADRQARQEANDRYNAAAHVANPNATQLAWAANPDTSFTVDPVAAAPTAIFRDGSAPPAAAPAPPGRPVNGAGRVGAQTAIESTANGMTRQSTVTLAGGFSGGLAPVKVITQPSQYEPGVGPQTLDMYVDQYGNLVDPSGRPYGAISAAGLAAFLPPSAPAAPGAAPLPAASAAPPAEAPDIPAIAAAVGSAVAQSVGAPGTKTKAPSWRDEYRPWYERANERYAEDSEVDAMKAGGALYRQNNTSYNEEDPVTRARLFWGDSLRAESPLTSMAADYREALPNPNRLSPKAWINMPRSTQDFFRSAYADKGIDESDVEDQITANAPKASSKSAFGMWR